MKTLVTHTLTPNKRSNIKCLKCNITFKQQPKYRYIISHPYLTTEGDKKLHWGITCTNCSFVYWCFVQPKKYKSHWIRTLWKRLIRDFLY